MRLVVAVDGERSANTALTYIAENTVAPDTEIHLIHVVPPCFADTPVLGIPDVIGEERKSAEKVLTGMSETLTAKLNAKPTTDILSGDIAGEIANACKTFKADLAIVSSHGRHGFSRFWFGSIADDIVDLAPCPVIVLKMPDRAPDTNAAVAL